MAGEPLQAATAYKVATQKLGVDFKGPGGMFREPGWFYVGEIVEPQIACPACHGRFHALRAPYTNTRGVQSLRWALACVKCRQLRTPASLGEELKKSLLCVERGLLRFTALSSS